MITGGKNSCSSCIGPSARFSMRPRSAKAGVDVEAHCIEPGGGFLHCVGKHVLWGHTSCVGLSVRDLLLL